MSRTYRKTKRGVYFRDGKGYIKGVICSCFLCTGRDRVSLVEKIANKEMLKEINNGYSNEE